MPSQAQQRKHERVEDPHLEHEHVLGKGFRQTQEAALRVIPSVCTKLLVVRLQTLHHTGDTELEVALKQVQTTARKVGPAR